MFCCISKEFFYVLMKEKYVSTVNFAFSISSKIKEKKEKKNFLMISLKICEQVFFVAIKKWLLEFFFRFKFDSLKLSFSVWNVSQHSELL